MSQYKISKARLKEIIKEEYEAAMTRTDEGHGAFGIANRDEEPEAEEKEEDEKVDEAHCGSANRDEDELENPEKADLDDDGKLSGYEKKRGKAIEKAMKKESLDSIRALIQQELKNL
jgi:hypothetical protein